MKTWMPALLLAMAGCGNDAAPPPSAPPKTAPKPAAIKVPDKAPEIQGDPAGKNLCLQCGLKTNDKACPKCKAVLVADPPPEAPRTAPGEVGKSNLAPTYACPKEGCTFTSARKEKCLPHPDIDLKEVWYTCAKDGVRQTTPGKCAKCGGDLVRELK